MKTFLALLAAVALYYAWQHYHPVQPPAEVVQATPQMPLHHLAPEGVYFLRQYVSVPTKHGVTGWAPGQIVRVDATAAPVAYKVVVTDGTVTAALDVTLLTNDMDEGQALLAGDQQTQAALLARASQDGARNAQERLAAQIQTAQNVQAASEQRSAASAMGAAPNRLNASASYQGSGYGGGGTVYYPVVVSSNPRANATASSAQSAPAGASAIPARQPAASANMVARRPATTIPTMSNFPMRPGMSSLPPVTYGNSAQ